MEDRDRRYQEWLEYREPRYVSVRIEVVIITMLALISLVFVVSAMGGMIASAIY